MSTIIKLSFTCFFRVTVPQSQRRWLQTRTQCPITTGHRSLTKRSAWEMEHGPMEETQ